MADLWTYRARPLRVVDGDTVDVEVDLGFGMTVKQRVRLHGIDTPEKSAGARWVAATEATTQWFGVATSKGVEWPLVIRTVKPHDKYGRWLATIATASDPTTVNDYLLRAGFAVAWDGTGTHPGT